MKSHVIRLVTLVLVMTPSGMSQWTQTPGPEGVYVGHLAEEGPQGESGRRGQDKQDENW